MLRLTSKRLLLLALLTAFAGCNSVSTKTAGITVDESAEPESHQVVIHIAKDGTLLVDGEACGLDDLGVKTREASANRPDEALVILKVNRETENSLIVSVMYELSNAGVANVSVVATE